MMAVSLNGISKFQFQRFNLVDTTGYKIQIPKVLIFAVLHKPHFIVRWWNRIKYRWWDVTEWWNLHNGPYYWTKFKLILTGDYAPLYVNLYEVDRHYGGGEEGGTWYDCGVPSTNYTNCYKAYSQEEATLLRDNLRNSIVQDSYWTDGGRELPHIDRYSMIGGPDVEVYIENLPATPFPSTPYRYE